MIYIDCLKTIAQTNKAFIHKDIALLHVFEPDIRYQYFVFVKYIGLILGF